MTDKNVPKIRFPGFSDPWEQRKIERYVNERNEKGNDELPILSVSIHSGVSGDQQTGTEAKRNVRRSEDKTKYKKVYPGDIVFNMMRAWQGAIGTSKALGMVSPAYIVARLTNEIDPIFLDYEFQLPMIIESINRRSYGVTDFRKRLYWDSFVKIQISIPNSKEEQLKIGSFFTELDRAITLHQRKLDDLKSLKSGLLQKMFPKPGSAFPEVRFPEFTDPWEQRKLGDFSTKVSSKNIDGVYSNTLTNSAEYGIIDQNDYFDKSISNPDNIKGYYIVHLDDFVYNPRISNLAPCGPIKRNKQYKTGIMSPLYTVFKVRDVDKSFLEVYFETDNWHPFMRFHGDTGARSDRFAIKDKSFFEMPIMLPSGLEQTKISNLFNIIDKAITLHQRKLENLKLLKQGLLQQMFV